MPEETVLKLFKSTLSSCQVITPSGKYIYFKEGRFATDDPEDLEHLNELVAKRHPHIYVQDGESEITATVYKDPLAEIKAKAVAEYLASTRDMGTSDVVTGMTTTADLVAVKDSISKSK